MMVFKTDRSEPLTVVVPVVPVQLERRVTAMMAAIPVSAMMGCVHRQPASMNGLTVRKQALTVVVIALHVDRVTPAM
jgi:hypothetical protein